MKKLVYSPQYRRKLSEIKKYLDFRFGVDIRKKALRTITNRLHQLQKHEESGVSLRELYGINSEYRYVYTAHNYVFYQITADCIRILNIYNEREDFMLDLFGVSAVDETAEAYWDEIEHSNKPDDQE